LSEVNRRAQEFTGRFVPGEDLPNVDAIESFVRALPRPANAAEQTLLKASLLDLAFRWSVKAHARYHGKHRCPCVFTVLDEFARTWRVEPRWDDQIASRWTAACARIGERLRAREDAHRLAAALADPDHGGRAEASGVTKSDERSLRRTFKDQFGYTPHDFSTRNRIARALPLLADGMKTERVAAGVGYRSKKNFFAALKKLTGLRPSEVRRLGTSELEELIERVTPGADASSTPSGIP
jgi:AraC-like DNA-binding protein